jgi:hypothetical protein
MKTKFKICIVLIILSFSCSIIEKKPKDIKIILLKKTEEIQPFSSFISDLDYIELKTQENTLVNGKIESIKLLDNDIIIKQRVKRKTELLRFSADGKFLNKIGQIGEGSGEINDPRDVILYNNGYAVWDQNGIKLFSKSGDYKEKLFETKLSGNRFFNSKNKFYLFHETTAPGYLSEYTPNGKLEHIFNRNNLEYSGTGYSTVTELAKDSFHLFSPINDTIYAFANEQLVPKYAFRGKSYPTLVQSLKKAGAGTPQEILRYLNSNRHWTVKTYLENKNFIFIVYQLGSYPFHLIIRKSDWQTTYIEEIINDIDGGLWDDPVYLSDNDELYIPLNAYQIAGHKIRNKVRHDFDKIIKEAELTGNPFVMRCKLK